MIFFATDKIYKIKETCEKNKYGQIVKSLNLINEPYMVNVQPVSGEIVKKTFGEDLKANYTTYVNKEMNFNEGDYIQFEGLAYEVEKKIDWKTYDILALKRVDLNYGS